MTFETKRGLLAMTTDFIIGAVVAETVMLLPRNFRMKMDKG